MLMRQELLEFLLGFISENRCEKFANIIPHRTRHITVALENIFQPHNASAVLRSCDCFGVQDVHIIENSNTYEVNPDVALGSSKWLNLHHYNAAENNTFECIQHLKASGYRVIATTPHQHDVTIDELDLTQKTALLFGTEMDGLSNLAMEHADGFVKIPMFGFTESFNISVSAALCLYEVTKRMRQLNIDWPLSEEEKVEVQIAWVKQTLKRAELLEKRFYAAKQ